MKDYRCYPSVSLSRTINMPNISRQRGASLFFAIVALVLMTTAGLALMRSVDTGNIIAGNMAFRESTVSATDTGVENAVTYLNSIAAPATFASDANLPGGCTVGTATVPGNCLYAARVQPEDEDGLPLIDWSHSNIPVTTINGNDVQYVIERLCNPDTTVPVVLTQAPKNEDAKSVCGTEVTVDGGSSKAPSGGGGVSKVVEIMYLVTVRVKGPRNTISTVQTILAR